MHPHAQRNLDDSYEGKGLSFVPPTYDNVVIFLHGLGDTAAGWESALPLLVRRLRPEVAARTKWVLPTAPPRAVTWNQGVRMPAWTDIADISPAAAEDRAGFAESAARVRKMVDAEVEKGIREDRIIVGGFSQGGAVAYHALMTTLAGRKLGGLVCLSTWLPFAKEAAAAGAAGTAAPAATGSAAAGSAAVGSAAGVAAGGSAAGKTPIFHGHGEADPLVRLDWGQSSVEALKSLGYDVESHYYADLDHSVCPTELENVAQFIAARLG